MPPKFYFKLPNFSNELPDLSFKFPTSSYKLSANTFVHIDLEYFRPTEVDLLIGNLTKAQEKLDWKPKYDLDARVNEMVQADIQLFRKDLELTSTSS